MSEKNSKFEMNMSCLLFNDLNATNLYREFSRGANYFLENGDHPDKETAIDTLKSIRHEELRETYLNLLDQANRDRPRLVYLKSAEKYDFDKNTPDLTKTLLFLPASREQIYIPFAGLIGISMDQYKFNPHSNEDRFVFTRKGLNERLPDPNRISMRNNHPGKFTRSFRG